MSTDLYDINFLRYLTAETPLSVFENYTAAPLYRDISPAELRRLIIAAMGPDQGSDGRGFHVYVSMPFCAEDCAYCHCSHSRINAPGQMRSYEDRLMREMTFFASLLKKRPVSSLYFGGGTPSLLAEAALGRVLSALEKKFSFVPHFHFNFEAHPSSLTPGKIALLQARGVSRISLGVQSLDNTVLRNAGRRQTREGALRCIQGIRGRPGIFLNVDLIAGLPGQSVASFVKGLRELVRQRPDSIHINPFSNFFSSRYARDVRSGFKELVELRQEMIVHAKDILSESGYARFGFEAYQLRRGTENIQQGRYLSEFENIIGLGNGAQSILYNGLIFRNVGEAVSNTTAYRGCQVDRRYFMANYLILHLLKGLRASEFAQQFGITLNRSFAREIAWLRSERILRVDGDRIRYSGKWTMEGLFEYFSATKVFFGSALLGALRNIHAGKYRPGHSYMFRTDAFVPKMDDAFFLLTLYDVGY